MRVPRTVVCIGALVLAATAFVPGAGAAPPEIARPGDAHIVDHVNMPVRGQSPAGVPAQAKVGGGISSNGISYRGGPVMNADLGVNVYLIWYGDWANNTATVILPTLITGLNGSPYYAINTTYYDSLKRIVPNVVNLKGQVYDRYSAGNTNLSDGQINTIVTSAISSRALPADVDGVYFVLTSADVTKSGFLTSYCGWHTHASIGGADIKYSFVGNPGANGACSVQTSVSPNDNVGADAMASIVAHELVEAATDPDLNAWYDSRGYENADKCAWTFGTTNTLSNGAKYNMVLGGPNGPKFLIQQNWLNASGGKCVLSYP